MILALHRCIVRPRWTSTRSDTPTGVNTDKSLLMTEPTLIIYEYILININLDYFHI